MDKQSNNTCKQNPKPNRKLRKALKEAEQIVKHPEKYKSYKSIDKLFKDLDS